ncbi:MAG: three-Cys-motif partner protein TcmP [Methylacidiphilales bacterium]|nr:three-Cys-motif partner protein TcmP [Candidatus Methylacidiphilales bacterium]
MQLLEGLQSEYPERRINVQIGDGNALIKQMLPIVDGRNKRGVAFLDPYGPHLEWSTLQDLGATKHFEVIINFPLGMAINRLITRSGEIPEKWRADLNSCFGSGEWENLVYDERPTLFGESNRQKVDDAAKRLLEYYVRRLKGIFGYVATPSVVRNTRGSPLYYMIWAGPHPLGHKIADHVLKLGERISIQGKRNR